MKKRNLLFSITAVAVTLAASLMAAPIAGTLGGEVTDPSGSVVAGAKVMISNGVKTQSVMTSDSGQFLVKDLAPGKYEVTVNVDGFNTFDRAGLSVVSGHQTKMDAPLELAPVFETVTVR
jgi:hypothetical protein